MDKIKHITIKESQIDLLFIVARINSTIDKINKQSEINEVFREVIQDIILNCGNNMILSKSLGEKMLEKINK